MDRRRIPSSSWSDDEEDYYRRGRTISLSPIRSPIRSQYHRSRSPIGRLLSPVRYRSRTPCPYRRRRSRSPIRLRSSQYPNRRNSLEHGNHNNNDGVDRISNLPDVVLYHILSFIDMKEVIGNTSKLSTRWRNLWMSLPILNFDHSLWVSSSKFSIFVSRVLLRHDDSTIKRLCFSYPHHSHPLTSVDDWMIFAETKHVEEVYFHLRGIVCDDDLTLRLPHFSKIQVLYLCADWDMQIPHSIFLAPLLKTLELESVILPKHKVLTLSCSVLENLSIIYCDHKYPGILNISAPKLNNLVLKNDGSCYNETCKLQISTPNLKSILLKGSMYKAYSLENLSSLVNAKFETRKVVSADLLRNILEGLHDAKTLELCVQSQSDSVIKSPSPHMLDHRLSAFVNLRCLKLIGGLGGSCIHTIHSLLMNSYSLEALVLEINQVLHHAHDWGELFQCIYRIKSIEIKGLTGCDNELKFLEFILRNAVALEELTLYTLVSFRGIRQKEELAKYNTQIFSLPRASSSVKILAFF